MRASKTLDYLYSLRNRGSSFGLNRMFALVDKLGNPHGSFPVIHVAGTNGKGSVCAMLASIYEENGYKVGLYTSPHLVELGERVQVNGEELAIEDLERILAPLKAVAESMEAEKQGMHPTFFEIMTAVAFLRFQETKVDLAILETGLGGRLDSTNVVMPLLSVITSISLDHCEILGNDLQSIAKEKAGIIKTGIPVVSGWLPKSAEKEIRKVAIERKSDLHLLNCKEKECPETNLNGNYQRRNAALALKASHLLADRFPLDVKKVKAGLLKPRLQGRWQVLEGPPKIILDACHNQAGVECLMENLKSVDEPFTAWVAVMGTDRAREIVNAIVPIAEKIVFFTPDLPRACGFEELSGITLPEWRHKIREGIWKDLKLEIQNYKKGDGKVLLVSGSIYLVGAVLSCLRENFSPESHALQDLI